MAARASPSCVPLSSHSFHFGTDIIERESTHQHYAVQVWPGLHCNHPDRYALRLLCSILADDSGSRLFWELIDTGRPRLPPSGRKCSVTAVVCWAICAVLPKMPRRTKPFCRALSKRHSAMESPKKRFELARNKIVSSLDPLRRTTWKSSVRSRPVLAESP